MAINCQAPPQPPTTMYNGDLKSDHLKSGNIWNLDFLKIGFQTVRFSIGRALAFAIVIVPTIWNPNIYRQSSVKNQLENMTSRLHCFVGGLSKKKQTYTTSDIQVSTVNRTRTVYLCSDFKWFLTKWRLSKDGASRFQIPFKIRTICNPTSFWPFKIQTNPDFRSPL